MAEKKLAEVSVRNAKPRDRSYKLSDGGGLHLQVNPTGSRWWRLRYTFDGKEQMLSLGVYPAVSLRDARDRRDEARRMLAKGINPSIRRRAEQVAASDSFEAIAREWHGKFKPRWSEGHAALILHRLQRDAFPWLGSRNIAEITAPQLLTVLRRIEHRGAVETAHRILQVCGQVFRYAVATGRAERDPSADLRGALPPSKAKHLASITDPARIGELLRAIDGYRGSFIVRCALRLSPLLFVRPGELRKAEWREFDMDAGEWRIPAARMKARAPHVVPLARQSLEILRELEPLTGSGHYVFPGNRSEKRPMSENTTTAALRRLGFEQGEMTAHGFRSMASTLLNEHGWNRDAIERQLAHAERDKVRAAYNYAQHLAERRKMMQAWADHLDALRAGTRT